MNRGLHKLAMWGSLALCTGFIFLYVFSSFFATRIGGGASPGSSYYFAIGLGELIFHAQATSTQHPWIAKVQSMSDANWVIPTQLFLGFGHARNAIDNVWYIPIWFPLWFWFLVSLYFYKTSRPPAAGLCPNCGYDLRASPDRCPECGTSNAIQLPKTT